MRIALTSSRAIRSTAKTYVKPEILAKEIWNALLLILILGKRWLHVPVQMDLLPLVQASVNKVWAHLNVL